MHRRREGGPSCTNSIRGLRRNICPVYEDALDVADAGIGPVNFDQANVNLCNGYHSELS